MYRMCRQEIWPRKYGYKWAEHKKEDKPKVYRHIQQESEEADGNG